MAVYFAKGPGGLIKIGFSLSPHQRLGEMGLRSKPVLLANIFAGHGLPFGKRCQADRAVEREMHTRFAHLRIGRSEWFRPAPDLLVAIVEARREHGVVPRPVRSRRVPSNRRGGAPVATIDDVEAELLAEQGKVA